MLPRTTWPKLQTRARVGPAKGRVGTAAATMAESPERCEGCDTSFMNSGVLHTLQLTPSVFAQDPALEPARITEGILPLWMNRGTFYVAGGLWAKYAFEHPWGNFEEWWERRERNYKVGNVMAKRFWAEFSHDKAKQAKILVDCALRRDIKCILDTDRPYAPAAGLLEPKPEPVDKVLDARYFSYHF